MFLTEDDVWTLSSELNILKKRLFELSKTMCENQNSPQWFYFFIKEQYEQGVEPFQFLITKFVEINNQLKKEYGISANSLY